MARRLESISSRGLLAAGICLAMIPATAQALPSNTPDPSAFATNGKVNAIVQGGGKTYIGGDFTELRANTGTHVRLDPATGKRDAPSPIVPSGSTLANIPDGAGGVYIAGGFGVVGNQQRSRVAHILADGSLDPGFNPPVINNSVSALAVSGGALYIGGSFTTVGGMPRTKIAKLSATTGNLFTTWNPDAGASPSSAVSALAVSGTDLFVGGVFTNIGGMPRNAIAKLSTTSGGAFSGWNPDPVGTDSFPATPRVKELVVSGGNLYVGGLFKKIGGLDRNNIAKLSTVSGGAFSGFDPNSLQGASPGIAEVDALALSDDATEVYAGGNFNKIGGLDRNAIAKLSATSGDAVSGWDPDARAGGSQGPVNGIAVSGDQVFASGAFETIGGLNRHGAAKISATSGNVFSLFNVNPRLGTGTDGQPFTIAVSAGKPYLGGTFDFVNNVARNRIAALDASGVPTSFDPGADGEVRSLALSDSGADLYAGGKFDQIGGLARPKVAKLSTSSGGVFSTFDAGTVMGSSAPNTSVDALDVSGTNLFVAGDIKQIGGREPGKVAKLFTGSGNAFASFAPDPTGEVSALAASDDGGELFVGGSFTDIGGLPTRNNLAKLSVASGNGFGSWNPNPNQPVRSLAISGTDLYAGGEFTQIGGQMRNRLAKLSTASGGAFSGWNPDVDGTVGALALSGSVLYAGGPFSSVSGDFRSRLAAISTASGGPFSGFAPSLGADPVSLAASPTSVAVGHPVTGALPSYQTGYEQFSQ